jgi:glutamate 5-kinase
MGIVPIINENDTVSTDEIEFGDNDTLSSHVAVLIEADLLILLSDIDGLYSADPRKNSDATIITKVTDVEEVIEVAEGAGTGFAKGGMVTKMVAARNCTRNNIDMVIAAGEDPAIVFEILEGKEIGTLFVGGQTIDDESPWSLKNLM